MSHSGVPGEKRSCTIVVPVHNAIGCTRAFLASLRETTAMDAVRVVVVDNGSTDGTGAFLGREPDVQVITNTGNRGFAAAVNQGLAQVATELACVVNNDVLFTSGWLDRLAAHLDAARPTLAIVVPSTNYAAGPQRIDAGSYRNVPEMHECAQRFEQRFAHQVEDVSGVVGLCLLADRATFATIGPLDESFGIGNYEDNDYSVRARRIGCRLIVARDVFLHHEGSQTFKALKIDYAAQLEQNRQIFLRKWGEDPVLGAIARARTGDAREALTALANAAELAPRCPDLLLHCAVASQRLQQWRESLEWLELYLRACPRSKDALVVKAHSLLSIGRPAEALAVLIETERCFYLSPVERREILHTMAALRRGCGEHRRAVELLEAAILTGAPTPQLYMDLVEAAAATGDSSTYAGAVEILARADEANVALQLELGQACRIAGDLEGARAAFERALALDPLCAEAQTVLRGMEPSRTLVS